MNWQLQYACLAPEHLVDAASRIEKPLVEVDNRTTIIPRLKCKRLTLAYKPLS
ncbi:MAG: hypothetical protein ABFS24_10400 [Pseudomonadota bacterium]